MQRWAEQHRNLNFPRDTDPSLLDDLPDFSFMKEMDDVPSSQEVKDAICVLHNGKQVDPTTYMQNSLSLERL